MRAAAGMRLAGKRASRVGAGVDMISAQRFANWCRALGQFLEKFNLISSFKMGLLGCRRPIICSGSAAKRLRLGNNLVRVNYVTLLTNVSELFY
jgi:hypothetical protein